MRQFHCCLAFTMIALSGCTADPGLQNIAQECRSEEVRSFAAEYPSPALVAEHDRLEQEAAALQNQAVQVIRSTGNPDAGSADINEAVQDSEDADSLYDYQQHQQNAAQCWQMLDQVAGDGQAQWARLQQQNAEDYAAEQARTAAESESDPTPPPQQPPEEPVPALSSTPPQPPQTYMDTPYAPMVPPALRTEPVGDGGPAVPPVAR